MSAGKRYALEVTDERKFLDFVFSTGKYLEEVESKANANLRKLTAEELSRRIERKRRDGTVVIATVEDYLIHLFQEETHHRGELLALLWQMNITPPHSGWIQYLNK